jgi:hypothetical protein
MVAADYIGVEDGQAKGQGVKKSGWTVFMVLAPAFVGACAVPQDVTTAQQSVLVEKTAIDGYCHKKIEAIGPTDLLRRSPGGGGVIDYYGPCDGPSLAEQIQKQKRFEQYRFGKEYMDEG